MATDTPVRTDQRPGGKPWPIPEFAGIANSSPRHIWRLIATGQIQVIRLGRKVMIADHEARKILAEGVPQEVRRG